MESLCKGLSTDASYSAITYLVLELCCIQCWADFSHSTAKEGIHLKLWSWLPFTLKNRPRVRSSMGAFQTHSRIGGIYCEAALCTRSFVVFTLHSWETELCSVKRTIDFKINSSVFIFAFLSKHTVYYCASYLVHLLNYKHQFTLLPVVVTLSGFNCPPSN